MTGGPLSGGHSIRVIFMTWTIPTLLEAKIFDDCAAAFPLEGCGLLLGPTNDDGSPVGEITHSWPAHNSEQSARIYSVDPKDMFEATRFGMENDIEIVGVYHSHTHTKAYPSPTDVAQAVDPKWCYAICSLAEHDIEMKYFLLSEKAVTEIEIERLT